MHFTSAEVTKVYIPIRTTLRLRSSRLFVRETLCDSLSCQS